MFCWFFLFFLQVIHEPLIDEDPVFITTCTERELRKRKKRKFSLWVRQCTSTGFICQVQTHQCKRTVHSLNMCEWENWQKRHQREKRIKGTYLNLFFKAFLPVSNKRKCYKTKIWVFYFRLQLNPLFIPWRLCFSLTTLPLKQPCTPTLVTYVTHAFNFRPPLLDCQTCPALTITEVITEESPQIPHKTTMHFLFHTLY